MNLLDLFVYLFFGSIILVLGGVLGFKLRDSLVGTPVLEQPDSSPRIVVNVPSDWKPLEGLPPTQIEGARATLYWTVFSATLKANSEGGWSDDSDIQEATDAADSAVLNVFGPLPV